MIAAACDLAALETRCAAARVRSDRRRRGGDRLHLQGAASRDGRRHVERRYPQGGTLVNMLPGHCRSRRISAAERGVPVFTAIHCDQRRDA
jgi:hypothetical protein